MKICVTHLVGKPADAGNVQTVHLFGFDYTIPDPGLQPGVLLALDDAIGIVRRDIGACVTDDLVGRILKNIIGLSGYLKRDVSTKKVNMVNNVEQKHNDDHVSIHEREK